MLHHFQYIPANPKKELILTRLGYKKNVTTFSTSDKTQLDAGIKEGLLLCAPQGIYGILDIISNNGTTIKFKNDIEINSINLAEFLKNSSRAVFMFATVGHQVCDRISSEISSGNPALGVILDSVASQTTDAAVAWISEFVDKSIKKSGQKLTVHRYSPGYGDLSLSVQKVIFNMLQLDKLGIKITDSFMLEPEKSVIAISGIESF